MTAAPWPPRGLEEEAGLARYILGGDEAHGWPHVVRVARLAWKIAGELGGVDWEVLGAAVLYHDIGRPLERASGVHHALASARIARARLTRLGWPPEKIAAVEHAILAHSYTAARELGVRPETLEAAVLSDADKLDAMGAVGIARAVLTGGQLGRSLCDTIAHLESKILRLPSLLHTEPARRIARRRIEIVVAFIEAARAEATCHPPSSP